MTRGQTSTYLSDVKFQLRRFGQWPKEEAKKWVNANSEYVLSLRALQVTPTKAAETIHKRVKGDKLPAK